MDGGCGCSAVRYRMGSAPMFVHCCHCKDCQRQTGTAFALNALIEADRVELLQGATEACPMPTDSGKPHVVHRCAACGTAVWSNYGGLDTLRFVRVGTLDAPEAVPPDVHIYTRSRLPWMVVPAGARQFEAYYSAKQEWPEASLARRRALLGG